MSKKTQPPVEKPNVLPKLLTDLLEAGNQRKLAVKQYLRGGLILQYRPPDETNANCRLLAYRLGNLPSAVECGVVKRELEKLTPQGVPINESDEPYWHDDFGCYLFSWSPNAKEVQLDLFSKAGAA